MESVLTIAAGVVSLAFAGYMLINYRRASKARDHEAMVARINRGLNRSP